MSINCLGGTGVPCPPLCVSSEMWSLFPLCLCCLVGGMWFGVGGGRA